MDKKANDLVREYINRKYKRKHQEKEIEAYFIKASIDRKEASRKCSETAVNRMCKKQREMKRLTNEVD